MWLKLTPSMQNQTELEKRKLPAPDENFSSELSYGKKDENSR